MRKIVVCLIILIAWLSAQNIMKLDSIQVAMNDTGKMSIHIENHDDFVGFQCDIQFPQDIALLT